MSDPDPDPRGSSRRETAIGLGLALVVVVAALGGGVWLGGGESRRPRGTGIGRTAPSFVLPVVAGAGAATGDRIRLEDLRGQVVVLDFWAGWCAPCATLAPLLSDVDEGTAAVVIGVAAEPRASPPGIAADHARFGARYPSVQATAALLEDYGVAALPEVVVVGPDGTVRARFTGVPSRGALLEAVGDAARAGPADQG